MENEQTLVVTLLLEYFFKANLDQLWFKIDYRYTTTSSGPSRSTSYFF